MNHTSMPITVEVENVSTMFPGITMFCIKRDSDPSQKAIKVYTMQF